MKRYRLLNEAGYGYPFEKGEIYPENGIIGAFLIKNLVKWFPQDWREVIDDTKQSTYISNKTTIKKGIPKDNINPNHYKTGKIECIDALEAATVNKTGLEAVCTANIIKYLWRYENKNGIEDIRKAKWYIEKLIKYLENE